MSRFRSRPTQTYRAAVNAMRDLAESEGDGVEQAAGEVLSEYREQFLKNAFKRSSGIACVQLVLGKHCNHYDPTKCHPPSTDHGYLLLKDGKPCVFVSEPYIYGWTRESFDEMNAFAERYGLIYSLHPERALHFPGKTVAIWWTRAG
jgi:hypothetical protein